MIGAAHTSIEGMHQIQGEGGINVSNGIISSSMVPPDKRAILQRPTKSAANKYRHIINGSGAIAEEIDYAGN